MSARLQDRLALLEPGANAELLTGIRRGIEKESLRVTPDGELAPTPHPRALGSALTHEYITTDFSEALLEFITPACTRLEDTFEQLDAIHRFVYSQLGDELLWAASMPCMLAGGEDIPVAEYGSSNIDRMKKVYRHGLGHRYGRLMQTIAGIHYNFSMPDAYWTQARASEAADVPPQTYITDRYLGLIRNFQRHSWLLIYLFGASPTVCPSFVSGLARHGLQAFDSRSRSLYLPYATSLRMGELGYQSDAQRGLDICYNQLESYIETLRSAIMRPHPDYQRIGVGERHERQLNTGLLQIENEFYSAIRPKRVTHSGEIPLGALRQRGVEYVEVRCVDVNPFLPLGIDAGQARFLDAFLLLCLLRESPPCDAGEQERMAENMRRTVNRGRAPGLRLLEAGGEREMAGQARELLDAMEPICALLDRARGGERHSLMLAEQRARLADPERTPSARTLREMAERGMSFFQLVMHYSAAWAERFRRRAPADERMRVYARASELSLQRQRGIEAADSVDFASYLASYYRQYDSLLDN